MPADVHICLRVLYDTECMKSPRGRPPEVDRDHLSTVALRLFDRDGFDAVTMDAIARAANVSRRTLFRLFPSKTDLVWDGLDAVLAGLNLYTPRPGTTLDALVEEVFAVGLAQLDDPAVAKRARRKLKLIAAHPSLLTHPTLAKLEAALATLLDAHRKKHDPPAALVAKSLFAVGFATVLWWVQNETSMTAREALRAALAALPRLTPRKDPAR